MASICECDENTVQVTLIPCGHIVCKQCSSQDDNCSICGETIEKTTTCKQTRSRLKKSSKQRGSITISEDDMSKIRDRISKSPKKKSKKNKNGKSPKKLSKEERKRRTHRRSLSIMSETDFSELSPRQKRSSSKPPRSRSSKLETTKEKKTRAKSLEPRKKMNKIKNKMEELEDFKQKSMDMMQQKDDAIVKCKEMVNRTKKLWKADKLKDEQRINALQNELKEMKKSMKSSSNQNDEALKSENERLQKKNKSLMKKLKAKNEEFINKEKDCLRRVNNFKSNALRLKAKLTQTQEAFEAASEQIKLKDIAMQQSTSSDYSLLKQEFDALKSDNDSLRQSNAQLIKDAKKDSVKSDLKCIKLQKELLEMKKKYKALDDKTKQQIIKLKTRAELKQVEVEKQESNQQQALESLKDDLHSLHESLTESQTRSKKEVSSLNKKLMRMTMKYEEQCEMNVVLIGIKNKLEASLCTFMNEKKQKCETSDDETDIDDDGQKQSSFVHIKKEEKCHESSENEDDDLFIIKPDIAKSETYSEVLTEDEIYNAVYADNNVIPKEDMATFLRT